MCCNKAVKIDVISPPLSSILSYLGAQITSVTYLNESIDLMTLIVCAERLYVGDQGAQKGVKIRLDGSIGHLDEWGPQI